MVFTKNGTVAHPGIKEVIFVTSGISPFSAKSRSQRISELPSLRYGPVGARTIMTGPLRLSNSCQSQARERRSSSVGWRKDKDSPIPPPRKVRFTLPPPDGTNCLPENPENSAFPSRNSAGIFNVNTEKPFSQRPTAKRLQLREKQSESAGEKLSLSRRFEKFRREHLQGKQEVLIRGVEVPVSVSPGVRTRVHPTARYIKGTLSPTSSQSPQGPSGAPGGHALLRAARDGDDQVLRDLLRRAIAMGIDVEELNATDSSGRTILSYIAANGLTDLLDLILQVPGIDSNISDNEGNTPLHYVAQAGYINCLNSLLAGCRSIEIDPKNSSGLTPLMKAALQGRNKCAKLLLSAGADPTLRDGSRGLRPDQWAKLCGRYACFDVIEKHARQRLLRRSTSYGNWGMEHDMGPSSSTIVNGRVMPMPPASPQQSNGLKSRIRRVFRTNSGTSESMETARLVTQLTSAALCASSPVLPHNGSVPSVVRSLLRPLTVPALQVTSVNNNSEHPNQNLDDPGSSSAEKDRKSDKGDHKNKSVVFADDNKVVSSNGIVKPTRTKKKK